MPVKLDRSELVRLSRLSKTHFLRVGESIFREGEPGERIFLLRRGQVEIYAEQLGFRHLAWRKKGEWFGEMACLQPGGIRSASARAFLPSRLSSWSREQLEEVLEDKPRLSLELSKMLSERMRQSNQMLHPNESERPRPGHRFGNYWILSVLGEGGTGGVYRARCVASEQLVALKVLHGVLGEDPTWQRRFELEATTLAKLEHPNIVRLVEWSNRGATPYLVMELIEGETLQERIWRGPLSPAELADWFLPVVEAIAHIHANDVVHRDIKPANIVRSREGQVKLLDFGLARQQFSAHLSQTGQYLGTPLYTAPERVGADGSPCEKQSDQYSLGVTLYEAATALSPFQGKDALSILYRHFHEKPLPPSQLNPLLPKALDQVLLTMLQKQPQGRFQEMNQLYTRLESVLQGGSSRHGPAREEQKTEVFDSYPMEAPSPKYPERRKTHASRRQRS